MEVKADDIKKQFVKTNTRFYLIIGKISCPTGKIIVADPLAHLPSNQFSPILDTQIPICEYPIEISICRSAEIGIRMCTARMKIKETDAIVYKLTTPTEDSAVFVGTDGVLSGFSVDAGMLSICDEQVAKEYRQFIDN